MAVMHMSTCTLRHALMLSIAMCVLLCSPDPLYNCIRHAKTETTMFDSDVCGRHESDEMSVARMRKKSRKSV